ncbi:MAG: 4-hydroxy-3-methylbut-2-enyl diphosphate reductase [Candidatus Wildermuthbacteria bacterium]|nr:4-hydroxy-3-methylbut-2-enyl diphosphate reductase [Candidatus Wildermuthbacteria bacterium]
MEIIVAKNIGFCTGVRRALKIANDALGKNLGPVYFLGEIIHNEEVLKEIKARGGKIISEPKEARSGTLVIRAHGAPPLPALRGVLIKDATCPLVKKVQEAAKTLSKEGYLVIIIGEKEHPEVKGIQGHIKNKAVIIENESEAKKIRKGKKIGVVVQTTQNLEKVNKILEILKKKAKKLKFINTLCPQVLFRQKELTEILKKVDGVLAIGSPTSANTSQLVKIAQSARKPVWLANSAGGLKNENFKNIPILGVISGTSTPDWVIEEVIDRLKFFC